MKPYKPHPYQRAMIKFGVGLATAGFFADPGLGKTSVMLAIFKVLRKMHLVTRMLVIAPLRPCYSVWSGANGEPSKWDDFKDLKIAVLHGPDKADVLRALDADVYVINYEGLAWLASAAPEEWPFQMLVCDESTRIKHTNTSRFKNLRKLLNRFDRRYILTGSPAPNGLLDLFGQIYVLDGGAALGKFITHYRMNYFDATGYGGYTWIPRPGADKQIYAKLKPLVLRMAAADYLDMEPYISNKVEVILPEEARKSYDQMERTLITAVEEEVVTAANVAAAAGKCRQIANGGIYQGDGDRRTALLVHEAKLDAVEEIIEELSGKPALVAYEYDHDRERLIKRLGKDTPYIGGGVTAKRFRELEAAWNAGKLPVLLAQPQSVAHGINLQGTGAAVIWHSLTWNLEDYEQLIRRVWRQGQKERVVVHHIVAKGTIDEVIMKTIEKKDRTQQALLDALKSHLKTKKRAA